MHFAGGTEESYESPSSENRCPDRELNRIPLDKSKALPLRQPAWCGHVRYILNDDNDNF
jgi:hypothetical protein